MRSRLLVRAATVLVGAATLAVLGCAAYIGWHNYHSIRDLFAADPPAPLLDLPRNTGVANLTSVSFASADGLKLAAWYVPSVNGAAIVITHGTNGDRSMMLAETRVLAQAGFGVLAFDWPGLGESAGKVRWDGQARRALEAAVDWLASRNEVDPGRIGGLGFSMGGFVMTQVAAVDRRLRAVVLEAAPPSFEDYLQEHDRHWGFFSYDAGWLAMHGSGLLDTPLEAVHVIAGISPRPVLLLVGTRDTDVPRWMVTKLYAAAREPRELWIVEGAGHGDYFSAAAAEFTKKLTGFFAANLGKVPTRAELAATTGASAR